MNYKIDIKDMHCLGCQTFIKMSLEEAGFSKVDVSLKTASATFVSQKELLQVKEVLDGAFFNLEKYKYSNLVLV